MNTGKTLSSREIHSQTKNALKKRGLNSPDVATMWGLKVNPQTTYYYQTPEERQKQIAILSEKYDRGIFKLINPK